MASMELVLGWLFIGSLAYILGVYTTVPAKAKYGARRGAGGAKRVLTLQRIGIPVGFLGGLAIGPGLIAVVAGAFGGLLGGFAGGIALSGIGLTNQQLAAAGFVAVVTFVVLSGVANREEDDD